MDSLFVGMSHLEVESDPAWGWDAATKDQFLRLLGPSLKLLALLLGSTTATLYILTAILCQLAGSLCSYYSAFFFKILTDLAYDVHTGSLLPVTRGPAIFGPNRRTNLGIFPENGGLPGKTIRGVVTDS